VVANTKIFFHVTDIKNLPNIKRVGLIPRIGNFSQKAGVKNPVMCLFKTEGYAINAVYGWLGEEYQLNYQDEGIDPAGKLKLAILKISLPENFPLEDGKDADGEIISKQKIPKQYISQHLELTLTLDYEWEKSKR